MSDYININIFKNSKDWKAKSKSKNPADYSGNLEVDTDKFYIVNGYVNKTGKGVSYLGISVNLDHLSAYLAATNSDWELRKMEGKQLNQIDDLPF